MVQETALNTKLGELLNAHGMTAEGQSRQASGQEWDVEVRGEGWIAACEAKKRQSTTAKRAATMDAKRRIRQGRASFAVAICYPDGTSIATLHEIQDLIWSVYTSVNDAGGWRTGTVNDLAGSIRYVGRQQLGDPDRIARYLVHTLDDAIRSFSSHQLAIFCRAVNLPIDKPDKGRNGAVRALLILAAAVMFHSRLDQFLIQMRPSQDRRYNGAVFVGDWPPMSAYRCSSSEDPVGTFMEAWWLIQALDYRPIFETARELLIDCHTLGQSFTRALRLVARAALFTTTNVAGLRHDLLGRIFHRVLDTARYDGSFYTSTAAATLLATLAIPDQFGHWSELAKNSQLRVVDPACGTGTLLMAVAERIRDLSSGVDSEGLSSALIEDVLHGLDINLTATHMAATTLGLLSPTTDFRHMNISQARFCVDEDGRAFIGSLEFMGGRLKTEPWPGMQIETGREVDPPISDLVIMNPPFTRVSLRYHQFGKDQKSLMRKRETTLFKDTPAHLSGSVGPFTVLGEQLTSTQENSTVAMVLPLTFATDTAGRECRRMLAEQFHIETIVCSHDPNRKFFSENTRISEILLVGRRRTREHGLPTRLVKLIRNPATPADAHLLAQQIAQDSIERWGIIQNWSESYIRNGDWEAVLFLSSYLVDKYEELQQGEIIPIRPLSSLAAIGPEGRRTRDAFKQTELPVTGMRALWHNKTDVTRTMAAEPDSYIIEKSPRKRHLVRNYWAQRSHLLLPTDPRLDTLRTMAVYLESPALGSRWNPIRPYQGSTELDKALCIWFNSSVGILGILGNRTSKVLGRPRLSITDMRNLPTPRLDSSAVRALASIYDRCSWLPFTRLKDVESDRVRLLIDQGIERTLRIDPELSMSIRHHISREPSVTKQQYETRR